MIERFTFSTAGLTTDQAFERYRDLYSNGSNATRSGKDFSADVTSWRLDRVILFDRRLRNLTHERPTPRVRDDDFSHFTVTLVMDGVLNGSAASGFERLSPGEIVLQDMRRPMLTTVDHARILTASVARDLIEAAVGSANGLHGTVIANEEAGLLADYMASLAARASSLRAGGTAAVSRAFVELLSLALTPVGGGVRAGLAREDFIRREAVQRFVEARLEDPSLDTAMIVAETGVSRTSLYRLMDPHGGVARFIAMRRVARVRAMIDAAGSDASLAELAERFAFSSAPRMSKKFKEAFGLTPSAYRQIIGDPDQAVAALRQRWAAWMVEVR